ncbi:MAG: hypothetical protein ACMZI0_18340 [Symbiopectobacterium sp.]|uniref:hypothetical protein n=1 Tax=Symbiopectobacterium sp. TaxID=2952789 RepID=UPI0039ED5E54
MNDNYTALIENLPDTVINKRDPSIAIPDILNSLKNGDRLSLIKSNDISAFCGIARGGAPFVPGFFVGGVAAISKKSSISFNKMDDNEVSCSFDEKLTKLFAFLAGTGQWLEKTLLKTSTIDYLTLLPIESNLIYVFQIDKSKNATLHINKEELSDFIVKRRQKRELTNFLEDKKQYICE